MRAAVIDATLAELAERGYSGVSLDDVAARADVHKTTVYRRWRTKGDAGARRDAGASGADRRCARHRFASRRPARAGAPVSRHPVLPAGEAVVRAVAGEAAGNPDIAAASRRFWAERLELDRMILRRARERGEIAHRDCVAPGD